MTTANLLIADQPEAAAELQQQAERLGYTVVAAAASVEAAVERAAVLQPDVVLMNRRLAGNSAAQAAAQIEAKHRIPVVLFVRAGDEPASPPDDQAEPLARFARPADDQVLRLTVEAALHRRQYADLARAFDVTLISVARAIDLREEMDGHSQRVADLAQQLALALGMTGEADLTHLRRGALLHDLGNISLPNTLLLKPGPLDDDEWKNIRQHAWKAYDLLAHVEFLRPALDIPYCHHEWWDGTGYPRGLKGEAIPRPARIFAVVDVWDALGCDRPYRPSWPKDERLQYLRDHAGTHFDPEIVQAFLAFIDAPGA